jgi:Na+/H+-dicarboxylate symporter
MNELLMTYIGFIIKLTPLGVCFLMADTFGTYGMAIFGSMLRFIATYWIAVFAPRDLGLLYIYLAYN